MNGISESLLQQAEIELKARGTSVAALLRRIIRTPHETPICIRSARYNQETLDTIREAYEHPERLTVYNSFDDYLAAMNAIAEEDD